MRLSGRGYTQGLTAAGLAKHIGSASEQFPHQYDSGVIYQAYSLGVPATFPYQHWGQISHPPISAADFAALGAPAALILPFSPQHLADLDGGVYLLRVGRPMGAEVMPKGHCHQPTKVISLSLTLPTSIIPLGVTAAMWVQGPFPLLVTAPGKT